MEELKAKHKEELEKAVSLLASNLKEDFDRIIAQVKRQHEQEKEEIRRTSGLDKEKELEMLRVELKSDYDKELERIKEEFDSSKTNALASLNTTLALKQAQENEKLRRKLTRKYEKEMDAIRSEMQDDFSRNALRQAEQLEMMEMNHKNELSKLKKEMEDKHQKLSDQLGESKSEKGQGFREAVVEEPIPTISLEKVEMMEELSQPKLPIPLVDTFAESQADSILGAAMSDMSMGEATLMEQSSFGTGMFRDSDFNLVGQTPSGLRKDPSSLLFADDKGNRASLGTDEERTPSQERMLEKIEKRLRHHELEAKMSREKLKEDLDKEYGMKIEKMTKEKEFEMEKAMEKLKMELDERYSQLLQERIQEKEAELKNLVSDLEEDHKNNLRKILTEKDEEFEKLKAIIDEKYRTELDDRIKEKESEAVTDHLALMEHHQKLIDEFVTEQEKQLTELKQGRYRMILRYTRLYFQPSLMVHCPH